MTEVVSVSSIEGAEALKASIEEYFSKGQHEEITEAIGMYSLLIDPQHTITDQSHFYRIVLDLIKKKVRARGTAFSSSWLTAFPRLMTRIITENLTVTTPSSAATLASQHAAYGPFLSVDAFFFWALGDRRLSLSDIVRYIEKTVEMHAG
jgi:hypothetical protein